ncbi:hypothetical protein WJX73_009291 [Symbiochloris irregularis]|uniref:NADH:ubiquinone oxidoreductase intermediate-associated protein 30 domain-containing protein n=1 Tax=Symbiochloris irregularis TaxID=706552 RepID=A0AAW1NYY9_9CHLO
MSSLTLFGEVCCAHGPRPRLCSAVRPRTSTFPRQRRRRLNTQAAASILSQYSPETLLAAGSAAAVSLAGLIGGAFWFNNQQQMTEGPDSAPAAHSTSAPQRKDAVLVIGATGQTGKSIVKQLATAGRWVVAAGRDSEKVKAVAAEASEFEGEVDVTSPASLGEHILQGVSQVVLAVGPTFNRTEAGPSNNSQEVDAAGVQNVVNACKAHFPQQAGTQRSPAISLASEADIAKWERLDDVIMGGQSESALKLGSDGAAHWEGTLRVEGGGFCGCRIKDLGLNLSAYDGLSMQVLGDGQTFKVNLKTAYQESTPECTYQAQFDTVPGEWTTVNLPWWQFVAVKRSRVDDSAPPLDPQKITHFGLVLSRFAFNDLPNLQHRAGDFNLQIRDGIKAFKADRPRIILVSSAGVERNALIGDDMEKRKNSMPIIQLNPGGMLNHKFEGENAVRASGLPYTIVRPTGLSNDQELGPSALEFAQGDTIEGRVTRDEVATVIAAALSTPAAVGKTLEVRRSEEKDAGKRVPTAHQLRLNFLPLAEDRHRSRLGLPPLPKAVAPPAPVTKERLEEILQDPRVKQAARKNLTGRDKEHSEQQPEASSNGASASHQNGSAQGSNGKLENAAEAKEWIEDWRSNKQETVQR